MKLKLPLVLFLFPVLAVATTTYKDPKTSATIERLSDSNHWKAFYTANPTAIPLNGGRDFPVDKMVDHGVTNGYSKFMPTNDDNSLMMAWASWGFQGMYRMSDMAFLGTVPFNSANPLPANADPRFDRGGDPARKNTITFAVEGGNVIQRQVWNLPSSQQTLCTAPTGFKFFSAGSEDDVSDDGTKRVFAISTGYNQTTGHWDNVRTGVADLATGILLPGQPLGQPNAVDMSPDGKYFAWLNHEGFASSAPNRFYLVSKLAQGDITGFIQLDSTINQGTINNVPGLIQSIAHNGWAQLASGEWVFLYQDNRDDTIKAFSFTTRQSTIVLNLALLGLPNNHISRGGPLGYFVLSTYGSYYPNALNQSIMLVEIATGKITELCTTQTKWAQYFTECWASIDRFNQYIYWASNLNGADNLEIQRVAVKITQPGPTLTPTPTPKPIVTTTPTPAPTATPNPHKKIKLTVPQMVIDAEVID